MAEYRDETFDGIRHINEYDAEYWYARELAKSLEYTDWRNFVAVIRKAMLACTQSGNPVEDHFVDVNRMVAIGSDAQREVKDIVLSRYACYLIVMNGDPNKEVIALGQTYFAVRTRQSEIEEQRRFEDMDEDERRLAFREELRSQTRGLNDAAKNAGVTQYGEFTDAGYLGLYGMRTAALRHRKGIGEDDSPMDFAGSEELAANIFRASQTRAKIKREGTTDQEAAEQARFDVGHKVRQTIQDLDGTLPEDLPTLPESVQRLEHRRRQHKLKSGKEDPSQLI